MYYKVVKENQHFVHGHRVSHNEQEKITVFDKYSGEVLDRVSLATSDEMERAVASTVIGAKEQGALSGEDRKKLLLKVAKILEKEAIFFADLIAREAGKPIQYAEAEVRRSVSTLTFAAEEALKFTGETIPMDYGAGKGKTALTRYFPLGALLAITPFNFPLNLALHKLAPALAVGCAVLLKPSPLAPLSSLAFARLIQEAGFPAGALNVVVCDNALAERAVGDKRFRGLSFTGQAKVGWHLKNLALKKKVTLELGGNAGVIVDASCDLPSTARAVALGAYQYAGQICISTQKIVVDAMIYKDFKKLLIEAISHLVVGDILNPGTEVGPMINREAITRTEKWVDEAAKKGANILAGGEVYSLEHNIYAPTLLENVHQSTTIYREEAFAPVATIEPYETFSQALDIVNNSTYGLQAGVFTNRIDYMKMSHEQLVVGGVMINQVPGFRVDSMPYGGVKDSGLGREGIAWAMKEMSVPRLLVY